METANATFGVQAYEHGRVVMVSGELDMSTAPLLGESIAQFSNGEVVVDLSAVEFIDSSGLKALMVANRLLTRRGTRLVIRDAPPMAICIMRIAGLDEVFVFENGPAPRG